MAEDWEQLYKIAEAVKKAREALEHRGDSKSEVRIIINGNEILPAFAVKTCKPPGLDLSPRSFFVSVEAPRSRSSFTNFVR